MIQSGSLAENCTLHIGGDQLTRERFSYGKFLRIGNINPRDRFDHIGPITFEFFHLGMNFMEKVIFRRLWKKDSEREIGTMRAECERIFRHFVSPDVMTAYDSDKEFLNSFVNAYVVEAAMDFFGLEDRNSFPTVHKPPNFENDYEIKEWVQTTLGKFVDTYVFPSWCGKDQEPTVRTEETKVPQYIALKLSNGQTLHLRTNPVTEVSVIEAKGDYVKNYAHLTLELGMIFKYFTEMMKAPDRDRLLGLFKVMLVVMKANNNKAKYPLEILRMLVQQYSLLPLQEACNVLQACFVNTKGKPDSHIPADQQMEWIVRNSKKHIKHMHSNKNSDYTESKSAALPGISQIADNFDQHAHVIVRAKKHTKKDCS